MCVLIKKYKSSAGMSMPLIVLIRSKKMRVEKNSERAAGWLNSKVTNNSIEERSEEHTSELQSL